MYVCIYVSAGHMSVGVYRGQEKMSESLELDIWVFWECREPNSGPREEQQVLQTTEPPPGPMYVFFTPYFVIKMLQGS